MLFGSGHQDGFVTVELDGFTALVNQGSVSGRGEEGGNSGPAGPNAFSQSALKSNGEPLKTFPATYFKTRPGLVRGLRPGPNPMSSLQDCIYQVANTNLSISQM